MSLDLLATQDRMTSLAYPSAEPLREGGQKAVLFFSINPTYRNPACVAFIVTFREGGCDIHIINRFYHSPSQLLVTVERHLNHRDHRGAVFLKGTGMCLREELYLTRFVHPKVRQQTAVRNRHPAACVSAKGRQPTPSGLARHASIAPVRRRSEEKVNGVR